MRKLSVILKVALSKSGSPTLAASAFAGSARAKALVTVGLTAAYVLAYGRLDPVFGNAAGIWVTLPVLMAAWFFGARLGLVAGLLAFSINSLLIVFVADRDWTEWVSHGGLLGGGAEVMVGFVVGLLRDLRTTAVTEMQQRRRMEERFRNLVENSSDIVWGTNERGTYTYCSPNMSAMTGYGWEELLCKTPFDLMRPGEAERAREQFALARAGNHSLPLQEHTIVCRDGHEETIERNGVPIVDRGGRLAGYRGVDRNVTERKAAQVRRRDLETKALAQAKLAALGEVAAGVAHEMSQPLTYFRILIQGLEANLKLNNLDEESLKRQLIESDRQVDRMSKMVVHLQTFGRADDSQMASVDLVVPLENALLLVGDQLRIEDIEVGLHVEKGVPVVLGNSDKLEQVFLNLFQNSIDALRQMPRKSRIEVTLGRAEDRSEVWIRFADNGVGIASAHVDRVYESFFTTKPPGEGTGLGLSIVQGIVTDHAGRIDCESELGEGTTFTITLSAQVAAK